jgi:hypothetical protein
MRTEALQPLTCHIAYVALLFCSDKTSLSHPKCLPVWHVGMMRSCHKQPLPWTNQGWCTSAGNLGCIPTSGWNALPNHVVDVILVNLSLLELARASTTCGAFQALYRRKLAAVQNARQEAGCSKERPLRRSQQACRPTADRLHRRFDRPLPQGRKVIVS